MLAFTAKKIVGLLMSPLGGFFGLLGVVLIARLIQRKWHTWHVLVGSGACIMLFVCSWPPTAYPLISTLESPYYAQFDGNSSLLEETDLPIDYVVVLGGGHSTHPHLPAVQQLQPESLYRLIEGIRLSQLYPGVPLIVSGGAGVASESVGAIMYRAALELGVPADQLIMETYTPDTQAQAAYFAKHYATKQLLVVTSAAHMTRSLLWFKHYGVEPIPVVTYFLSHPDSEKSLSYWFPKASALYATQRAIYEWIGILYFYLKT